jgi:hypothetical protein
LETEEDDENTNDGAGVEADREDVVELTEEERG